MSEEITERVSSSKISSSHSTLSWSLLLFLIPVLHTAKTSSCVRPFSIQHGGVNMTETNRGLFPVGTVDGSSVVVCTREGLWSSGPPHCLHNSCCIRPFSVQHGRVNVTETNRGSFPVDTVLQYSCDSGYTVDGPDIIVCTREGLWSSGLPRCLRNSLCGLPFKPENGGYTCHPSSCHNLTHGTVVEYFCHEGFTLKGDYKYLTCQNGDWVGPMQISCVLSQENHAAPVLGIDTLSIMASTVCTVALVLFLVVVFMLLQPKLKSLHNARHEQGGAGQPVTIMVEGVHVTLPSYAEAVSGPGRMVMPGPIPHQQLESLENSLPQTSLPQDGEIAVVQQPQFSFSSSSSSWSLEGTPGATAASSAFQEPSQQNGRLSLHSSEQDLADDIPLLKES